MTAFPPAKKGARDLISSIHFEGFNPSWAGPFLGGQAFCFGSEDGRILYSDYDGVQPNVQRANHSGEAINGVAFMDRRIAASTRNEIMIFTLPSQQGEKTLVLPIQIGAHDVIAGVSGYFFAPLGHRGILTYLPADDREQRITIGAPAEEVYFYRIISMRSSGGQEVIACATRTGGVASMEFLGAKGGGPLGLLSFGGLDVVDICPLVQGEPSTAAAALGRDGTIILFSDVLRERKPVTIRYGSVQGVAYRVLSAGGNLFLLTSEGLYVIAGLVEQMLIRRKSPPVARVLKVPMEVVDANAVGDRWILIITPDTVLRLDVGLLEETKTVDRPGERLDLPAVQVKDEEPTVVVPEWESRNVEQKGSVFAGV